MTGTAKTQGWRPRMADSELAWELADTAKGHLDPNQHNEVYIAIGVGDAFSAATFLLQTLVRRGVAVHTDLMLKLNSWVASYRDHPDGARLRDLVGRITIAPYEETSHVPPPPKLLSTVRRYRRPNRMAPTLANAVRWTKARQAGAKEPQRITMYGYSDVDTRH